jgi:predicted nucleic acid-binding protein
MLIVVMVDTTVWVDFFNGENSPQVQKLEQLLADGEDICICGIILTEILQGIRDESEYKKTRALFEAFLFLSMDRQTFLRAAELYRGLRRQGITVRKTMDCMIASVAIENDVALLHNDKNFDPIRKLCGLKVVHTS